jgi:hypothetical protein
VSLLEQRPEIATAPPAIDFSDAEPELIQRERRILHSLLELVSERGAAEVEIESGWTSSDTAADQAYNNARQALSEKATAQEQADRQGDEARRRAIIDAAIKGEAAAKADFAQASRTLASEFDGVRDRARNEHNRARAAAAAAFEAAEREAGAQRANAQHPIDDATHVLQSHRARLDAVFADYQKFGLAEPSSSPSRDALRADEPPEKLFELLGKADEGQLPLLESLWIPRAMKGRRWIWLFVILFLALIVPLIYVSTPVIGASATLVVAIALGLVMRSWLYNVSRAQVSRLFIPLNQLVVDGEAQVGRWRSTADERLAKARAHNAQRRDDELARAKRQQAETVAAGEAARDEALRQTNDKFARRMVDVQTKQQVDMRTAVEDYEKLKITLRTRLESNARKLDLKYHEHKAKLRARHDELWTAMAARWRAGIERARDELDEITRSVDALGPPWDDPGWSDRPFPRDVPPVVRFGSVRVDLAQLPGGLPTDPRLLEQLPTTFAFPALRPFPSRANLAVEAPGAGRPEALKVLQAAMLRVLTSLPPAQVRFTIIDPIGIGRNFGAFMHLADFDEALVSTQVWTEPRQIEERLADLASHMERVTQRYLRNEYATIEAYNAVAGEVAEPYRVLVVADFPASFDDKAAARLAAIATSGIPCGVLTFVAVDRDRALPPGVSLDDLRAGAVRLATDDGRLAWDDADFGRYPLILDAPPPADVATRLILRVGAAARDAKRVEVPFEFIAPPRDSWWNKDSRGGIDVPLGKSGATKRQHLALGHGTSQHVLIAGRTGSGKSTLLHALIVNSALNYSPDEVDLYLIDFKKGVEFKVYATAGLPHASVVAIESEREFGISVLQRLDAELRERAERFRAVGVQDLAGYRDSPGTPPLPRILLIVDEFQEFFVEEDKLAQEAALLLDRLVRQGRAFGVHVHLGSQTLAGAFTLARSTLGQMAVRIALQCSESDAHLILSESNPAARLLSRPGEAVYNDANGLPEGNHFFQVVWLSDERREVYLKQLSDLARQRQPVLARTPIIFEGDAPAQLERNMLLAPLLQAPAWPHAARSAQAWFGDAVAIKDPTSALFRRQGASHLLIVGQNDEAAHAIMAASLLGLAAQYPPRESETTRSGARFAILDGTPEDSELADCLARVAGVLPHPVDLGAYRDVARILSEVAAEVERRQQPGADDGPEIFLLIQDLPRFRELRRREDDFGFSRREGDATPADNLRTIVREGPVLGIHLLAWCDNLNNLNRIFDNQALREFEMRVLFQMSPTDSAHLLDAPHASRLGPHRAYFSSGEQNRLEKFRPYGFPAREWLEWVRGQFARRLSSPR